MNDNLILKGRSYTIHVLVSESEYDILKIQTKNTGSSVSVSRFIRSILMKQGILPLDYSKTLDDPKRKTKNKQQSTGINDKLLRLIDRTKHISIRVTKEEYDIVKEHAKQNKTTVSCFIYVILVRQGVLPDRISEMLKGYPKGIGGKY